MDQQQTAQYLGPMKYWDTISAEDLNLEGDMFTTLEVETQC